MTAPALLAALALLAQDAQPPAAPVGEPLPPGAPTQDYPLTAWCFGALSEYLDVYEKVKPDLVDIDKKFGTSVKNEPEPYSADMAAARDELKMLASAVSAAEQASPTPIAPQGVTAIDQGRAIWRPAEDKTRRELARAWLSWAMPDRCDTTARALEARSALLGKALKYNDTPAPPTASDPQPPVAPAPAATAPGAETAPTPPAPAPDDGSASAPKP